MSIDKKIIKYIIVIFIITMVLSFCAGWIIRNNKIEEDEVIRYDFNDLFVGEVRSIFTPDTRVLGMLIEDTLTDEELFLKILECENSTGDPTKCNLEFGCSSGIGDGQLTAIAIKDCEKNLGKEIDPYNAEDNMECSRWLYNTYGTAPWGCEDCWWGSWDCWSE